MILLDTNIVSEVMRKEPSPRVLKWLNWHSHSGLLISSITIAEIYYGLRILPSSQRRQLLQTRFEQFIAEGFAGRIIAFDEPAARAWEYAKNKVAR